MEASSQEIDGASIPFGPKMKDETTHMLEALVTHLARQQKLTPKLIKAENDKVLPKNNARLLRATVRLTNHYRLRQQFGRLRSALLYGTTVFGAEYVTKAERSRVLLSDDMPPNKFGRFLAALQAECAEISDANWQFLSKRLMTYLTYHEFAQRNDADEPQMRELLRSRPRHTIKLVLALTHLAFLRHYFHLHVSAEVGEYLERFGPPEDLASIASLLVALANKQHPLDSLDFAFPATSEILSDAVRKLLDYGRARYRQGEIAENLSLFGYMLVGFQGEGRYVYQLRPPFSEFEYSLRLGFIRSELGQSKTPVELNKQTSIPELSLLSVAEMLFQKWRENLCEIREEIPSARRVRLHLPAAPGLYKWIAETHFYEDLAYEERLGHDFMIPLRGEGGSKMRLSENLDLATFHRMWRQFQFVSLLDVSALKFYADRDRTVLCNSLLRVMQEEDLVDFISLVGVTKAQAKEFLQLVAADVRDLGYFDVQYRPFLRIATTAVPSHETITKPEVVHIPGLIYLSNVLRNVQVSNQFRIDSSASIFVDVVAEALRGRFARVTTNRPVESGKWNTDIDVAVLEGNKLYLFECKYSLPPTDPHEMRDVWEDIELGIGQLHRAKDVLQNAQRRQSYLTNWFPGTKLRDTRDVEIVPCLLSSHRIFSGMHYDHLPVRDFASLALLLSDGVVGLGSMDETGKAHMYQYRIVNERGLSAAELDDYLSEDAVYFKMFRKFTREISLVENFDQMALARDTFVHEVDSDDWLAHMDALGFTRLADKEEKIRFPMSLEELLSKMEPQTGEVISSRSRS